MSGGNGEASAIAALALALHQAPARHAELLRGNAPLPPGVGILLRLAGGTSLHEMDPALASLAPESELRKAAMFFIEQVLFRRDADHYRLLGLNRDATPEQTKEHHRLLMRMFHPDRDSQLDERKEQFAIRANLAYNTLRDAGQRSSYDASLKQQPTSPRQPLRRPAPVAVRRVPAKPDSFWSVRVYPLFMRYLPQWVLAGTALVSMSIVGAVYLKNQPIQLPQPAVSPETDLVAIPTALPTADPEVIPESAAEGAARLDELAVQFERRAAVAEMTLAASDDSTDAAADMHREQSPAKLVESQPPRPLPPQDAISRIPQPAPAQTVRQTQPQTVQKPPVKAVHKTAPKPVQRPAGVAAVKPVARAEMPKPKAAREIAPKVAVVSAAPAPEPVRPVVVAAVITPPQPVIATAPEPPLPDPDSLLKRFHEAYERGDMQACMSLLDESLRANLGGKPEIRREYDELFRSTDLRHIKILSMNWSRDGEFIRGEGRYRATLMRKGETVLRTHEGKLRIEMVRRGNSALINELFYINGVRS